MTEEQKAALKARMISLGLGLAAVYLAYKFAPKEWMKAAALGAGGVMVGKQLPYVSAAL